MNPDGYRYTQVLWTNQTYPLVWINISSYNRQTIGCGERRDLPTLEDVLELTQTGFLSPRKFETSLQPWPRNWGFHWNTGGSSSNPCADTYMGSEAFSEIENKNARDFIWANKDQIKFYNNMHSYRWPSFGQEWVFLMVFCSTANWSSCLGDLVTTFLTTLMIWQGYVCSLTSCQIFSEFFILCCRWQTWDTTPWKQCTTRSMRWCS